MRILILVLAFCLPDVLFAQHNHFIYIQGENQQLFYVKRSGEVLSSSVSGFLILSKLQPGNHQFTVGFPKDQFPEYEFQVELNGKDRGFTLKNMQDKGWGLLDLQTQEVIMGRRIEKQKEEPRTYGDMSDDPFAVILASVVNDPGIRETSLVHTASMVSAPPVRPADKPIAQKEQKPSETKAVAKADPATAKTDDTKKSEPAKPREPEPVATVPPPVIPKADPSPNVAVQQPISTVTGETAKAEPKPEQRSEPGKKEPAPPVTQAETAKYKARQVEKISELKTWTGYQLTYVDFSGPKPDTIIVTIDDPAEAAVPSATAKAEPATDTTNSPAANSPMAPVVKAPRTDCRNMAREKDVLALRKKMLTFTSDAEMVDAVIKEARNKCFTVEQLQNLSYVFVNDDGRVLLFEQAYPYVFDPANYKRLETQLSGEEQLSRFRNLIK